MLTRYDDILKESYQFSLIVRETEDRGVRHLLKSRTLCLEIDFEIRNKSSQKSAGIKVISRTWKSQKSGLKSVEIRNQLEIKVISKSRTRFQQVSDPSR